MNGNSIVTQVIVLGLALAIAFTYIKPTLAEIGARQDEIQKTKTELETINAVNNRLNDLVKGVEAIPQVDKTALFTYIPDKVDEVRVLKDLSSIAAIVGVAIRNISYDGQDTSAQEVENTTFSPIGHVFSITVISSYDKVKKFLALLEQNEYPLEITTLELLPIDGGYLELNLTIMTYAHE